MLGDQRAPYKREIERFHSALASLAEIVAFVFLGLTINLTEIARSDVWVPGSSSGWRWVRHPAGAGRAVPDPVPAEGHERIFVLFAGLKGAVPILLGISLLTARVPGAGRLYGIVAVVVAFSSS